MPTNLFSFLFFFFFFFSGHQQKFAKRKHGQTKYLIHSIENVFTKFYCVANENLISVCLSVCLSVIHSSSIRPPSSCLAERTRSGLEALPEALFFLSLSLSEELRFFGCVAARWSAVTTSSRKYLKYLF